MSATTSPDDPETALGSEQVAAIYRATYDSFAAFVDVVASKSFERFVRGEWVLRRCRQLGEHDKTVTVGPRDHFKSTCNYLYVMWRVWRARFNSEPDCEWADGPADLEILYFSFNKPLAQYHVGAENPDGIKNLIDRNPWFDDVADAKGQADGKAKYTWDGGTHHVHVSPQSVQSMVRGRHADIVVVDDPFQDDNKQDAGLDPGRVLKINRIFKDSIMSIPSGPVSELHVATTPQTDEDFTFDDDLLVDYERLQEPAIQDYDAETVLWPEWKGYDDLVALKAKLGDKSFNQEYQVTPRSSEIAFVRDKDLERMAEPGLTDYDPLRAGGAGETRTGRWDGTWKWGLTGCVAGLDIGKKQHPAHLAVFGCLPREVPDEEGNMRRDLQGHLFQIHQHWFDGDNYSAQVEYCRQAIDYFDIDVIGYDDTRGEFEALREQGQLPTEMVPVNLGGGTNHEVAGALDVYMTTGRLRLLDAGRQNRQLQAVTNDLQAVETGEGHAESFWSVALACHATNLESTTSTPEVPSTW